MPTNVSPPAPPSPWTRLHLWQIQAIRDVLVVAVVIAIVWLGYAMRAVTTPLLVALGLAYLFEPVIAWITRRWSISRATVVISVLLVLGGGVAVALAFTTPLAIRQTASLVRDARDGKITRALNRAEQQLPDFLRTPFQGMLESFGLAPTAGDGIAPVEQLPKALGASDSPATGSESGEQKKPDQPAVLPGAAPKLDAASKLGADGVDATSTLVQEAAVVGAEDQHIRRIVREELGLHGATGGSSSAFDAGKLMSLLRGGLDTAGTVLGAVVGVGLLAFLIPFYFFFFSVSYPTVLGFFDSLIPRRNRDRTLELLRKMDGAVAGFVRGRLVISAIVGTIMSVGWFICGVPYSIVLGIVVGIFNLVPYLAGIGWPIAVGLLAVEQLTLPPDQRMSWLWVVVGPSIVFILAQTLDGYVLTPLIAGKATDLDPVTIVVAVIAGGSIAGVYGMLLAIPVAACAKILIREVLLPQVKKWLEGRASDPLPM